jgi:hypothetical protein
MDSLSNKKAQKECEETWKGMRMHLLLGSGRGALNGVEGGKEDLFPGAARKNRCGVLVIALSNCLLFFLDKSLGPSLP